MTPADLDADVRRDLRGLQKETAESVARHLVAAGLLVDEDPEQALQHVRYARKRAARIAVVREAAGIVAYHAGEWNEALGEFRAARRMGGSGYVPVMADIERALGRPERALDLTRGPEARGLDPAERVELLIVAAGARRDLGELEAAVVGLQVADLDPARRDPWSARLFYAYADNLLAADRRAEAVQWFVHAYDADPEQETDAAARIADLTGDAPPGAVADDEFVLGVEDVPEDAAESEEPARADVPVAGASPAAPVVVADLVSDDSVSEDSAVDGSADDASVEETALVDSAADDSPSDDHAGAGDSRTEDHDLAADAPETPGVTHPDATGPTGSEDTTDDPPEPR